MKLGRKVILLLLVMLLLLFVAAFALKTMQYHGNYRIALREMFNPIRRPLIRFLRALLKLLED